MDANKLPVKHKLTLEQVIDAVQACHYPEYEFSVFETPEGERFLQCHYMEPDTVTGIVEQQNTRKWLLTPDLDRSGVVQTAFKAVMTSFEHRVREHFHYKGRS